MTRKSRQRRGALRVVGIIRPVPSRPLAMHAFLHVFGPLEAHPGGEAARASSTRADTRASAVPRQRALYAGEIARLSQHGLRRVLGTSALFSTAYGNVGSSIYYALGL